MNKDQTKELTDYIERKMEESSKLYVTITSDFLKWNTAFAVGGILWLGNFITTSTLKLNCVQIGTIFLSMIVLFATIVASIVIFYNFTRYWNLKWKLYFDWQNSVKNHFMNTEEQTKEEYRIGSALGEQDLPNLIKDFNNSVYLQMTLLIFGYALMIGFMWTLR